MKSSLRCGMNSRTHCEDRLVGVLRRADHVAERPRSPGTAPGSATAARRTRSRRRASGSRRRRTCAAGVAERADDRARRARTGEHGAARAVTPRAGSGGGDGRGDSAIVGSVPGPEAHAERRALQAERARDLVREIAMVARVNAVGRAREHDDRRRAAADLRRVVDARPAPLRQRRLLGAARRPSMHLVQARASGARRRAPPRRASPPAGSRRRRRRSAPTCVSIGKPPRRRHLRA